MTLSITSTVLQINHSLSKKLTKVNIAGDREYRIIYTTISITSSYIHHQPTKYKNISVYEDKKSRWKCKPAGMSSYNYRFGTEQWQQANRTIAMCST